jgi:hypothetical protein
VPLDARGTSEFSCCLLISSSWLLLVRPTLGGDGTAMLVELADCLARLPEDGRVLIVGSVKLAMALVVLSRARAAKVNKPVRFALLELVVDWVD